MKLLQIIVLIIGVYTVDCRDDPDGYEDLDSTAGEPEGLNSAEIDPEQEKIILPIQDSMDENSADLFYYNKTGHIISRAGSKCKAKDVCIIMGGSCVTNTTLCEGRLVPGACKGAKCQCCVSGTLATKIESLEHKLQIIQANFTNTNSKLSMEVLTLKDNLTDANSNQNSAFQILKDNLTDANSNQNSEFQTLKDNLTDANSNQNSEFQTLKDNLTDANSNQNREFQTLKDNLTDANSNQNIKFQILKDNLTDANSNQNIEFQTLKDKLTNTNSKLNMEFQSMQDNLTDSISNMMSKLDILMKRCHGVDSFQAPGSSRCYKFYNDAQRTWTEAKGKCQQEGLVLAEPDNPIPLRKYLVQTYGQQSNAWVWLGARSTGSYYKWETSGRQISNTDSLWYRKPSGSYLSTSRCLRLMASKGYLSSTPNQPYYPYYCTYKCFTLCEVV